MPYRVTLRSTETRQIQIEPGDLPTFQPAIAAATPDGWELIDSTPKNGTGLLRSRETRDIEITSRDELATCAPDGWQAQNIIAI